MEDLILKREQSLVQRTVYLKQRWQDTGSRKGENANSNIKAHRKHLIFFFKGRWRKLCLIHIQTADLDWLFTPTLYKIAFPVSTFASVIRFCYKKLKLQTSHFFKWYICDNIQALRSPSWSKGELVEEIPFFSQTHKKEHGFQVQWLPSWWKHRHGAYERLGWEDVGWPELGSSKKGAAIFRGNVVWEKGHWNETQKTWIWILTLLYSSHVILGNRLDPSEPQFPPL